MDKKIKAKKGKKTIKQQ